MSIIGNETLDDTDYNCINEVERNHKHNNKLITNVEKGKMKIG